MIAELTTARLANTATPRRCSCSCIATHVVIASRAGEPDRTMPACDRCVNVIRNGAPRLRSVA